MFRLSIQALPLMKGWKNPKYRAKKTYVLKGNTMPWINSRKS